MKKDIFTHFDTKEIYRFQCHCMQETIFSNYETKLQFRELDTAIPSSSSQNKVVFLKNLCCQAGNPLDRITQQGMEQGKLRPRNCTDETGIKVPPISVQTCHGHYLHHLKYISGHTKVLQYMLFFNFPR